MKLRAISWLSIRIPYLIALSPFYQNIASFVKFPQAILNRTSTPIKLTGNLF